LLRSVKNPFHRRIDASSICRCRTGRQGMTTLTHVRIIGLRDAPLSPNLKWKRRPVNGSHRRLFVASAIDFLDDKDFFRYGSTYVCCLGRTGHALRKRPQTATGAIPPVEVMGKRSVARRKPARASPRTAVPRTAAIRASPVRCTQQPLHASQREYA